MADQHAKKERTELILSSRSYFEEVVSDAMETRGVQTIPMTKQYIIDVLDQHVSANQAFNREEQSGEKEPQTLAELYLTAASAAPSTKIGLLKRLGDKSLFISGFFGDSLSRKIVDIDYYMDMGGAAYRELKSCVRDESFRKVYGELGARFVNFVDVLSHISEKTIGKPEDSLIRLYEVYLMTGSEAAKERLVELGHPLVSAKKLRKPSQ